MSLKHAQLQDSIIGRSYVKIAQEKGWIQEEPLKKEASAPDFQPTHNLMENILKLCQGLRQSGFGKYAEELESKFVQFKQANCHYDVSGESGEDLIHAAHPKGSHKLDGVDSDEGVIETVLDQHMKILEKIQKMPHGKLSTAAEVIDAVKTILGQEKKSIDQLYQQATNDFQEFRKLYSAIILKLGKSANDFNTKYFDGLQNILNKKQVYAQSEEFRNYLLNSLQYLQDDEGPGIFSSGDENKKWNDEILPIIEIAQRYANSFRDSISGIQAQEAEEKTLAVRKQYDPSMQQGKPGTAIDVENVKSLMANYLNTLAQWRSKILSDDTLDTASKKTGGDWINERMSNINVLKDNFEKLSPEKQVAAAPQILANWAHISSEADQFRKAWFNV